ncbi:hypothetical protein EVAR_89188_1 [Eumeta japonica]|uniref:Uncharacterized protein n=1 Tax=Eumeta variegata TaxID=151549 RepID=A0A4C1YBZ1_EUMVA|nr:hypothetical protein EVAR_89188_1 [Eumeta japonica]
MLDDFMAERVYNEMSMKKPQLFKVILVGFTDIKSPKRGELLWNAKTLTMCARARSHRHVAARRARLHAHSRLQRDLGTLEAKDLAQKSRHRAEAVIGRQSKHRSNERRIRRPAGVVAQAGASNSQAASSGSNEVPGRGLHKDRGRPAPPMVPGRLACVTRPRRSRCATGVKSSYPSGRSQLSVTSVSVGHEGYNAPSPMSLVEGPDKNMKRFWMNADSRSPDRSANKSDERSYFNNLTRFTCVWANTSPAQIAVMNTTGEDKALDQIMVLKFDKKRPIVRQHQQSPVWVSAVSVNVCVSYFYSDLRITNVMITKTSQSNQLCKTSLKISIVNSRVRPSQASGRSPAVFRGYWFIKPRYLLLVNSGLIEYTDSSPTCKAQMNFFVSSIRYPMVWGTVLRFRAKGFGDLFLDDSSTVGKSARADRRARACDLRGVGPFALALCGAALGAGAGTGAEAGVRCRVYKYSNI